jgi:Tol biopolymer transport system component
MGGGNGEFAFVSEKTGSPQVYLGSLLADKTRQITKIPEGACQPHWSPDGKKILFTSPCLSKQKIIGKPEPFSGSGIFMLTLDGGIIRPILSLPGGDFDADWSPDGNSIIFTSIRSKYAQIYWYEISTEKTIQLTKTTSTNRQPAWSPDGSAITYSSTRNGPSQIWIMDKDGSNPRQFSILSNGAAFSPDWSPDGREIIYSQTNSLRLATKIIDGPGSLESVVNDRINYASNPDYSPDGNWILIDSNMDGLQRVYRISRNGTGLEPLSPSGEIAYQPEWKPALK